MAGYAPAVTTADLERTLRLYPAYQACRGLLFWQPVFLLFFAARVTAAEALLLVAAYDLAAVVLEVPSGYLSDALGRRLTLALSATAAALGALTIALGEGFAPLLAGQALLGASAAFNSGTDSALLWDTLSALGRRDEFAATDAGARRPLLLALGASALVGGLVAPLDDRAPYVLTAVAALGALAIATRLREPPDRSRAAAPLAQLAQVVRRLRDPVLLWLLGVWVGLTVLNHVPYAFLQPFVQEVLRPWEVDAAAPAIVGVLVAVIMGGGWLALPCGVALLRRFGGPATLLVALALQLGLVAAMTLGPSFFVVALLLTRMVPMALADPVLGAVVHPRLDAGLRATYLSVQNLLGMLAFSGSLALAARVVGVGDLDASAMARVLPGYVLIAGGLWGLLALFGPAISRHVQVGSTP